MAINSNDPILKAAVQPTNPNLQPSYGILTGGGVKTTQGNTVAGSGTAGVNVGEQGLQTATSANAGYQTAGYQTVDPIYRAVDRPTETVQGQLTSILDAGSPLMERARAKALEGMNSRGLLNSSMAIGAGQAAVYDVALPIASQDAQTYGQTSRDNQAVGNQTQQFNATNYNQNQQFNADSYNKNQMFNVGEQNTTARTNAQFGNQLNITNIQEAGQNQRAQWQIAAQREIAAANNATTIQAAQMGHANARLLAEMNNNHSALIQGNQNASAIWQQGQANITNIQMDPNLSPEARANAVNQQISQMQQGMRISGAVAGVDFGSTLDWGAAYVPVPSPAPGAPASGPAAPATQSPTNPNGLPWQFVTGGGNDG